MNELSKDLLFKIFNYLNVDDLINLKEVNTNLKSLIDNDFKFELVVIGEESSYDELENCWFYSNEPINVSKCQIIDVTKLLSIRSLLKLAENMKSLILNLSEEIVDDISYINEFKNLEKLKLQFWLGEDNQLINLPNLKILDIENYYRAFILTLEAEKLIALRCHQDTEPHRIILHLNYSNSLIYLELDYFAEFINDHDFKNLEFLKINNLCVIKKNILNKLVNLKLLECNFSIDYFEEDQRYFSNLKNAVRYIVKKRKALRRNDLLLIFQGVRIENLDQVNKMIMQ